MNSHTKNILIRALAIFSLAYCAAADEVKIKEISNMASTNQSESIIIRQDGRQEGDVSLNGEWDFTFTPSTAKKIPDLPPESTYDAKVKTPGYWDDQRDSFQNAKWWTNAPFGETECGVKYLSGIGWHRRIIDVPTEWDKRSTSLTVGCVPGHVYIWLNRFLVGQYDYGVNTPISLDLTDRFKAGEKNELIIALDNTKGIIPSPYRYGSTFHERAGGILDAVSLHISQGAGRITDLYIKPGVDLKEVVWDVDLDVPKSADNAPESRLLWAVSKAADNAIIAHGEVSVPAFKNAYKANWKQKIDSIEPWSDRHPNLYRTKIQWLAGKQILDKREERFGLRRWSYEGRKLFLNGQPIYLRQDQIIISPLAHQVMSGDYWRERLKRGKELGFNSVFFDGLVTPPQLLDAADELGIIACPGLALGKGTSSKRYKEIWRPILVWSRPHPSACIYNFFGEVDYYEGVIEQYQKQNDLIKAMNPESMVMPQQAARGIEYAFDEKGAKELTNKPFPHHAERLAQYTKASDIFGTYINGAFGYDFFNANLPWRLPEKCWAIYQRPSVVHEIYMRSSYLNPDNAKKYTGALMPSSSYYSKLRDQLDAAGMSDKWRTYWENSGKLNAIARKYCVEKTRKCDNLAGYETESFVDQTYSANAILASGMLDEFLQLKSGYSPADILRYNNENVLLLDFEDGDGGLNRSYWAKDILPADIMLSLYGKNPITSGTLSWTLKETESGKEVWKGECDLKDIRNGYVSAIHSLKIEFPDVQKTTKLNFIVNLTGSDYQLANDWDFWVFPKVEPPEVIATADKECKKKLEGRYPKISPLTTDSKEKLRIISELTQKDLDYLTQGGDALLLGTKPFPVHMHNGSPGLGVYPGACTSVTGLRSAR